MVEDGQSLTTTSHFLHDSGAESAAQAIRRMEMRKPLLRKPQGLCQRHQMRRKVYIYIYIYIEGSAW